MTARTLNAHGVAMGREAFERQEQSRRFQMAKDEEHRSLLPLFRLLVDMDLMYAKVTITLAPDGTVTHSKEYAPEIQAQIDKLTDTIRWIQESIWEHHFPASPHRGARRTEPEVRCERWR